MALGTLGDDHHVVETVIFDQTKLRNRQGTGLFMSQLSIHLIFWKAKSVF